MFVEMYSNFKLSCLTARACCSVNLILLLRLGFIGLHSFNSAPCCPSRHLQISGSEAS